MICNFDIIYDIVVVHWSLSKWHLGSLLHVIIFYSISYSFLISYIEFCRVTLIAYDMIWTTTSYPISYDRGCSSMRYHREMISLKKAIISCMTLCGFHLHISWYYCLHDDHFDRFKFGRWPHIQYHIIISQLWCRTWYHFPKYDIIIMKVLHHNDAMSHLLHVSAAMLQHNESIAS